MSYHIRALCFFVISRSLSWCSSYFISVSTLFRSFSYMFSYLQPFFCTLAALSRFSRYSSSTTTKKEPHRHIQSTPREGQRRSWRDLRSSWGRLGHPLGRFGDHVGSSEGLLGRSPELSGSFLGALGESLGRLGSDCGGIFGICLMDSGICFRSKSRPITKRYLFGSLTKCLLFFSRCRNYEHR